MKLKFKQQDFQTEAVNAVCSLFEGQRKTTSLFDISFNSKQTSISGNYGIGNELKISTAKLLSNMQKVQEKNGLCPTDDLAGNHFSIEMETGTGKTYVYTKTIFELNKQYGFTKFIVVVPSIAIREGVYKSMQITKEHFDALYDNVPWRHFIYNSSKLAEIQKFALNNNIEIMIISIDSFNKITNVINKEHNKLNDVTPIEYIQSTNPIVIIDEPQSVDNTQKAKDAIAALNPLCVLRYSATHRERINLLYRLTPVDAYQMGLVKQISVSSIKTAIGFNKPYIKLLSVSNAKGFKAKIEIDAANKYGKVKHKIINIKPDEDLYKLSGYRDLYADYKVTGIDCTPGFEQIELSGVDTLRLNQAIGDVDENLIKRTQIRRTIEAHLDKELRYTELGIKVLSLFFIDKVEKYRTKDGEKGIYAQMFEELYTEIIHLPKYAKLLKNFPQNADLVHDGYFSQDKKGNYKNTKGDTQDDYTTYNTIMKQKEWLLSFDCSLRFIFSHSALKEGWDNPNVFQICTLLEQQSVLTARQKIGRGLRLCVNQNGERIEDSNINVLHIMANESFVEFAENLQKEIEDETGQRFGVLSVDIFSGIKFESIVVDTDLQQPIKVENTISYNDAQNIISHFKDKGYIDKAGKITDSLKNAIQNDTLDLPKHFENAKPQILTAINKCDVKIPVRDASKDVTVRLKKNFELSPAFIELWNKIKQRTVYRVTIDEEQLINKAVKAIQSMPAIPKAKIITQNADIQIKQPGVTYTERGIKTIDEPNSYSSLPNLLAVLGEITLIKRNTIYEILKQSKRLADFLNNPQLFIENVGQLLLDVRRSLAIDGIKYEKITSQEYFVQEIFNCEEFIANLDKNAVAVKNSIYDYIVYDSSTIEKPFAVALDNDPEVEMFFKLPGKFIIDTPIGEYNPDWAVYLNKDGTKKLYFVLETKGSDNPNDLRPKENMKIQCGKAHFKALNNGAELFGPVKNWQDFKLQNI